MRGAIVTEVLPSGHIPAHLDEYNTPAIWGSMFCPRRHEAGLRKPETSMAGCSFIHFLTDSELSSLMIVCGMVVVFRVRVRGGGSEGTKSSRRIGRREVGWIVGSVEEGVVEDACVGGSGAAASSRREFLLPSSSESDDTESSSPPALVPAPPN